MRTAARTHTPCIDDDQRCVVEELTSMREEVICTDQAGNLHLPSH